MNFKVTNQTIERTDSVSVIADSINYLTANFKFSSDWDTLEKHVTFTLGSNVYDKTIDEDDEIKANQGLNLTEGAWTVGVVGIEAVNGTTVERITADTVSLTVSAAGALGGEAFPEISGAFGEAVLRSEAARVVAENEREAWYAEASALFIGNAATAPTGVEGAMFYNTATKHFFGYNGTAWKQLDN